MVTLYTQPTCAPCVAVKRRLDNAGIEVESIDITESPESADLLKAHGFIGTPVISSNGKLYDISHLPAIIKANQLVA